MENTSSAINKRVRPEINSEGFIDGHVIIASSEDAEFYAKARHITGNLEIVANVAFESLALNHIVGSLIVERGAKVNLPGCKCVEGLVILSHDSELVANCETIGLGFRCSDTSKGLFPECRTVGKSLGDSFKLTGSSYLSMPKLEHVTGRFQLNDRAIFSAPRLAQAIAHSKLLRAQQRVRQAKETGEVRALHGVKKVVISARDMASFVMGENKSSTESVLDTVKRPSRPRP